jgi:hypothetical protein
MGVQTAADRVTQPPEKLPTTRGFPYDTRAPGEAEAQLADDKKTEEQLIVEGDPGAAAEAPPVELDASTRRGLLRWIAPVLASLGTVAKVGTAHAHGDDFAPPVPTGRCKPRP